MAVSDRFEPTPEALQQLIDSAVSDHQSGNLASARDGYRRVLEVAGDHAEIVHLLGVVYYQMRDLDQAADTLRRAIELNSTDASYWSNLGNVLRARAELPAAIEAYQTALRLDENMADASNNLANAYIAGGQLELATEVLEAVCGRSPNHPEAHNNLGIVLKAAGRIDDAVAAFTRATELRRDYVDALQNLGNTYLGQSEVAKAVEAYGAAIGVVPADANLRLSYGNAFMVRGDLELAKEQFTKAKLLAPEDVRCAVALGRIHQELGDAELAEAEYRAALDLDDENPDALNNLGVIFRQRGDLADALRFFTQAAETRDEYLEAVFNCAAVQIELSELDAAETELVRIREKWPNFYPAWQCLADVYDRQGDIEKSKQILEEWLEEEPNDPVAQHLLLAANGDEALRCSVEYVREEFDRGAQFFDSRLAQLDYKGPELTVKALRDHYGDPRGDLDVLDAGCGTGLSAKAISPYSKSLVGVDLSSAMMDEASKLNFYDAFHCEDLTEYLISHAATYDLIIAMDVLIYFGELSKVLAAGRRSLREGGSVIFTVEAREQDAGYKLQVSGRFHHNEHYVRTTLAKAGFEQIAMQSVVLRMERNKAVWGWLIRARALGSWQDESDA